ncbi:DUF2931 family protein [Yokenella regensburgei]|uniref:DUF2931 family protein n=1 Tax=Yokenella regensburgei TaxID=158877 RepID=UPI0013761F69|nr:DUF2931 family protein [Yokenella regensburgei]KAF1371098.1 cold shock CspA family protein [Yokenella regensburgei]
MSRFSIIALAMLVITTGCNTHKPQPLQSQQAASGDWTLPYDKWGFGFITPWKLPAVVTHARVIDTDGYLHTFNTLDPTSEASDSVGKWFNNPHGSGFQFNKVKKPPQYMIFCWESYIDQKTYETSSMFAPDTWLRMKTPASDPHAPDDPVWFDTILFGLAPGGHVKTWFPAKGDYPALPFTPFKLTTRSGNEMTLCKHYIVPGGYFEFILATQDFIKGKTYPYGNWD